MFPSIVRRRSVSPEEAAYRRLLAKGWQPASIIDVGAYEGNWTKLVRRIWNVPVLMVEAQEAKKSILNAMTGKDICFSSCALGASEGNLVTFYEMETGSSYFPEQSNAPRSEAIYVTQMLDCIASDMSGPLFLKIDVQGAELEVLKGGESTLTRTELVQLEIALLPYNAGAPAMYEVLDFMRMRSFVPLDIAGFSRPNGIDLVQIDVLFCKEDSPLRPKFIEFEQFKL